MLDSFEVDTQRMVATLPRLQQEAICLVHVCGCSQLEAGEQLGISQPTLSRLLAQAYSAMRAYVNEKSRTLPLCG